MAEQDNNKGPVTNSMNTFIKGMNKDVSKYALPADQYYDAKNVRVVASRGKEGASLVNVEGNEHLISIPCSPAVWELTLDPVALAAGGAWSAVFTVVVQRTTGVNTWSLSMSGTGGNPINTLAKALKEPVGAGWLLNGAVNVNGPSNIKDTSNGFLWSFDESSKRIVFWGKPRMESPEIYQSTSTLVGSPEVDQVSSISLTGGFTLIKNLASPQCNVEVIGSTAIRNDIYLFTTNFDPGNGEITPASVVADGAHGQIWRLNVNSGIQSIVGIIPYLECIYSGGICMNFSKQHPVEAIGRYEKKEIQGIYWTDNFNPPRKLNVASPDAMATPCAFLDLAPKTSLQIPTLQRINIGGNLESGIYQLAYRYKNSEGLVTDWSPLSNLVPIYAATDDNAFCQIPGDLYDNVNNELPTTSKSITWSLIGLDISYEFIELAALYRIDQLPASASVYIFAELTNGLVNLDVTLTGNEDRIPLGIDAFLQGIGTTFERVKTLSSKDNKLFFGNITNTSFDVTYESRAYRFNSGQQALLESQSDASVQIDGTNFLNPVAPFIPILDVPEQHDAINPYNDESPTTNPNWFTNDQYIYQADGVTLGGEGFNISYKFITEIMEQDQITEYANWLQNPGNWWADNSGSCTGFNFTPSQSCFVNYLPTSLASTIDNLGIAAQNYPMNNTYNNYKSPYKWSLYGGYSRGETYRFGIVFYNNKGQASFVNWIGDIKFPYSYSSGAGNPLGSFAIHNFVPTPASPTFGYLGSNYDWVGTMFTNNIGIEFSVNLDPATSGIDVAELGITGYSIVRCDRTAKDMSRFGTATVHTTDRLEMEPDDWDDIVSQGIPNLWGVGNDGNVLIPSVCNHMATCGGGGLSWRDGVDDSSCGLYPWAGASVWNGSHVCMTRKREVLLYGPLGWKNSDPSNAENYEGGLGFEIDIAAGDYLKIESVYLPVMNTTMGLNNWIALAGLHRIHSNHWYKHYYPAQLLGGIPGSNQSTVIDYTNGVISNANGHDPLNNRLDIKWGTHVEDGGRVPSAPGKLDLDFVNVTNPGSEDDVLVWGAVWPASRPHSIGGEGYLIQLDQDWVGANVLMGASNAGFATQNVLFRATFSYEKYITPYGGITYATRQNSEYMSCGHFMPIATTGLVPTPLGVPFVHEVWGGDVTTQIYDFTQMEKNWGQTEFDNYDSLVAGGWSGVPDDATYGMQRNCMFPAEVHHKNILWRSGYHFASKGNQGAFPNNGTSLHDEFLLNKSYTARNNVRAYFPRPLGTTLGDEFDTRVYYSETKINGEPTDSWATFLVGNYKDVEGVYGPMNKLVRLHDTLYYFQNTGFGALSVNPTAVVQGSDGTELQLGTVSSGAGAFIQDYKYISTQYGAKQQWAVTTSDSSIYFFDIIHRKMFNYSQQGTNPLSDITGMHSWFLENLQGTIMNEDNPILKEGINCTFDFQNNEALFTFHDKGYIDKYEAVIIDTDLFGSAPTRLFAIMLRDITDGCNFCLSAPCDQYPGLLGSNTGVKWPVVDNLMIGNQGPFKGYIVGKVGCANVPLPNPNPNGIQIGDVIIWIPEGWNDRPFSPTFEDIINYPISEMQTIFMDCAAGISSRTVGYSELISGYTSFYDFNPSIYISNGTVLITPNTEGSCISGDTTSRVNELYIHNVGRYGHFYNVINQSSVTLISNALPASTKAFDNVSFHMESLWYKKVQPNSVNEPIGGIGRNTGLPVIAPIDITDDTFDKIRFYTDYQMSDYVELIPGQNIRKKEREWQMAVPRNIMNENLVDADIFNVYNYDTTRQFKDRMRDKYLLIELIYNNFDSDFADNRNIKFVLHYFRTFFRHSFR